MVGLGIIAEYRGPEFSMALGRFFKESYGVPFTIVCAPHLLTRASALILQAAFPGFGWNFFKLNHFVSICHLQNGEVFHLHIVVVLMASEPHVFRQILEVNFHEGNAVVIS